MNNHFDDLSLYSYYLKNQTPFIYNVGWVSPDKYYTQGNVPTTFIEKLVSIFNSTGNIKFTFNEVRGNEPCCICNTQVETIDKGRLIPLGYCELLIPSIDKGFYYASPSLIIHYIKEHHYQPPEKYIDSVLALDLNQPFNAQECFDLLKNKT